MAAFGFPIRKSGSLQKKTRDVDKFSLNVPRVCMACWTATKLIHAVVWVFFLTQKTCSFCLILCF